MNAIYHVAPTPLPSISFRALAVVLLLGAGVGLAGDSPVQAKVPDDLPNPCRYRTIYHVGCEQANGKTNDNEIFDAIWAFFKNKKVKHYDGKPDNGLVYWLTDEDSDANAYELDKFLEMAPGKESGRCQAWGDFFKDCVKLQGVNGIYAFTIVPMAPSGYTPHGLYVKNCDNTLTPGEDGYFDKVGVPGQGIETPQRKGFLNHVLIYFGDSLYDPSYGTGPFPTLLQWQNDSLDAIRIDLGARKFFERNPGHNSWPIRVEEVNGSQEW